MITDGSEPNTLEWWEDYFAHKWERNQGRDQTRGFMQTLTNALPGFVVQRLSRVGVMLLDWGCALGEGVDVLAQAFPNARVHGYDISAVAISKARAAFPELEFRLHGVDTLEPRYDAVICSNVLEHFDDPLLELRQQLLLAALYHISLVPYNEQNLEESHRVSLTEDSFPFRVDFFRKVHQALVRTDPNVWAGEQLLTIYASPRMFAVA